MADNFIDKYQLHELLGSGATADVYRATDQTLGREVALKLLKPSLVSDATAFNRFMQEARAAAVLFHPYIATVYEMGESEGRFYIAMRYIPGRSLNHTLKEDGPLPWAQVQRMAAQLGEALDFAHSEGFLHRDVKTSNIICAAKGDYVLTDFGLVRAMANTGMTTHTGALLGTPAYIAPEIWNGEEASPASDQYALACVLYEAITGEALFTGVTPQAIITNHLIKGPQFPTEWPKNVPSGVEIVMYKALATKPSERYKSVIRFATEFVGQEALTANTVKSADENIEYQETILPATANTIPVDRQEKPNAQGKEAFPAHNKGEIKKHEVPLTSKRTRTTYFWVGGVLLILFAFVIGLIMNSTKTNTQGKANETSYALKVAQTQITTTIMPNEALPVIDEAVDTETAGNDSVIEATLTPSVPTATSLPTLLDPTATKLPTLTPTLAQTPWGGGSDKIAFVSDRDGNKEIYLMNTDGTELINLTQNEADDWDPTWSPDGNYIAFVSNRDGNSEIYVMRTDGSNPANLTNHFAIDREPAWSPNGAQIAFMSNRSDLYGRAGDIFVVNVSDADQSNLTQSKANYFNPAWNPNNNKIIFVKKARSQQLYNLDNFGVGRELFSDIDGSSWEPAWSPNGSYLAFTNYQNDTEILRVNSDGTSVVNLTNRLGVDTSPNWSSDSLQIAYVAEIDGNQEIFIMGADGSNPSNLTQHSADDTDPAWAPTITDSILTFPASQQPTSSTPNATNATYLLTITNKTKKILRLSVRHASGTYGSWNIQPDGTIYHSLEKGTHNFTYCFKIAEDDSCVNRYSTFTYTINADTYWEIDSNSVP